MFHSIEDVLKELKQGSAVLIIDEEKDRGALVTLLEHVDQERIELFVQQKDGNPSLVISTPLAEQLDFYPVLTSQSCTLENDAINSQTIVNFIEGFIHPDYDHSQLLTSCPLDILAADKLGVLKVPGFSEAAIDLAKLAGAFPACLISEVKVSNWSELASKLNITMTSIAELANYRKGHEVHVVREVETVLPSAFGDFRIVGYSNDLDDKEHIAIVKGDVANGESVMTRIHSECFTGDIFGSYRCDCGPQLHAALAKIEAEGKGIIVYMRQEGRGIGLINKLKAYKLQDQGRDTHEANLELGFKADAREYHLSAQILQDLDVKSIQLLTNNPDKIKELEKYGVQVTDRVPLQTGLNETNAQYMETKLHKFGHMLNLHS